MSRTGTGSTGNGSNGNDNNNNNNGGNDNSATDGGNGNANGNPTADPNMNSGTDLTTTTTTTNTTTTTMSTTTTTAPVVENPTVTTAPTNVLGVTLDKPADPAAVQGDLAHTGSDHLMLLLEPGFGLLTAGIALLSAADPLRLLGRLSRRPAGRGWRDAKNPPSHPTGGSSRSKRCGQPTRFLRLARVATTSSATDVGTAS